MSLALLGFNDLYFEVVPPAAKRADMLVNVLAVIA
jgi:hypothetical protein